MSGSEIERPGGELVGTMRRFAQLTLTAVIVVGLVSGGDVQAERRFRFHGSGNGHGIGLSQWGSYGLARAGWSADRILRHFYRGTSVGTSSSVPGRVRVGITYGRGTVHLTARSGGVRLWLSAPGTGTMIGRIRIRETWTVTAKSGGYAIRDQDGVLVGGRRWGGTATHLFATYEDTDSRVFIPESDDVYGSGHEYSRGHVEFNLYGCASRCALRLIVPLRFEEYLFGIAEVPTTWPVTALRAQAIAARSYAAHVVNRPGDRAYCNCDITDGTIDQVYTGYDREGAAEGARWVDAVVDTRSRVVTYEGTIIQAFYASSNGGHSENVENVWHGGNPAYAVPWLRGVCDPGESTASNPWTDWSRVVSVDETTSRLRPYTGDIGRVTRFTAIDRGRSGRIVRLTVRGRRGQTTISGSSLRSALGLRDTRVWINSDHNIVGRIRNVYDAAMCRPGLPAERIELAAGEYQRFQVGSISHNERAGLTVWLRGPIEGEYRGLRGATGRLGLPTSKVTSKGCRRCGRIRFQHGRIYWKDGVGAYGLWGPVLGAYLDRNGTSGPLGWPTSRPRKDGSGTWSATFQDGTITCPADERCSVST